MLHLSIYSSYYVVIIGADGIFVIPLKYVLPVGWLIPVLLSSKICSILKWCCDPCSGRVL